MSQKPYMIAGVVMGVAGIMVGLPGAIRAVQDFFPDNSADSLLRNAGRTSILPPDVFDVLQPDMKLDFVTGILGPATRTYETNDAEVFQYKYKNSQLTLISRDGSSIAGVLISADLEDDNLGFTFPTHNNQPAIDLVVGESNWDDVLRVFPVNGPKYTFSARWDRLFAMRNFGAERNHLDFYAGSRCGKYELEPADKTVENPMELPDNHDVLLHNGDQIKISYIALSSFIDLGEYDFLPTSYSCY